MNIKFTEEMIHKIVVYSVSLVIAVVTAFFIYNLGNLSQAIRILADISVPFLIGIGLAFILRIPVMYLETHLFQNFKRRRLISAAIVFIAFIFLFVMLVALIIPNVIDSVESFLINNTEYSNNLSNLIDNLENSIHVELPSIEEYINNNINTLSKRFLQIANYSIAFIKTLINVLLAMVSAFYLVLDKEKLSLSLRKLTYAIFSMDLANHVTLLAHNAKDIFDKYIFGSIIDSSIIGIVTFIVVSLLGIPYASMIAFIIGITNLIPVFGPFLGAVPVLFLLLLINPIYSLFFLIFIIVLQQLDGNVLKPLVLGEQLGLSGFWILFSVTVGGGLGGVLGMFLGVPIFAFIYQTVGDFTEMRLKEKKITNEDILDY